MHDVVQNVSAHQESWCVSNPFPFSSHSLPKRTLCFNTGSEGSFVAVPDSVQGSSSVISTEPRQARDFGGPDDIFARPLYSILNLFISSLCYPLFFRPPYIIPVSAYQGCCKVMVWHVYKMYVARRVHGTLTTPAASAGSVHESSTQLSHC